MKIAHFGTFDVENYGDLLFPLLIEKRLGRQGVEFVHVSPVGGAPDINDCKAVIGFEEALAECESWDAIVLGGGALVHGDAAGEVEKYRDPTIHAIAYPGLWLLPALISHLRGLPLIWNATGVPWEFSEERKRKMLQWACWQTDYLAVRDIESARVLRESSIDANVVPDTAVEVAGLWSSRELNQEVKRLNVEGRWPQDRYLALHLREWYANSDPIRLAENIKQICDSQGASALLMSIGGCHGDEAFASRIMEHLGSYSAFIFVPESLRSVAAAIGHSAGYVGSSLHGAITAFSFARPFVLVANQSRKKFSGFLAHIDATNLQVSDWAAAATAVSAWRKKQTDIEVQPRRQLEEALDQHWTSMSSALAKRRTVPAHVASRLLEALSGMPEEWFPLLPMLEQSPLFKPIFDHHRTAWTSARRHLENSAFLKAAAYDRLHQRHEQLTFTVAGLNKRLDELRADKQKMQMERQELLSNFRTSIEKTKKAEQDQRKAWEKAANLEGKLAKQDRLLAHRDEQIAQEKKTVNNLRAVVDKVESALAHMRRLVAQQKDAIERRDLWRSDLQARLDRSEKVQRKLKEFLKKSGRETDRIVRSSRWKLGSLLTFRNAKLEGGDAKDRFVREFKEWEKALPPLARESSPAKETFSSEETTRGTSPKTAQPFLPPPVVAERSPCLFSITIISSTTNIHGGTKRLLQVAQLLHERGHHVTFVTHFAGRSLDWFQLKAPHRKVLFDENSSLQELETRLPDGDILLTYGNNRAASLLDRLSRRKGLKYLLFMHMGVHDRALDEANAFLPNFSKLATTRWIAEQLAEVGADPKVIGFGINSDQFFPLNRPREFRIGTLLHKDDWKRSADVVKAFRLVRQQIPQARLVAYGQLGDPNLGVECEYHLDPEQDKLREIYSSCAVWVTASLWEGIGMCSVEAMLCKTPLVTTDTGGSRDFCHDQNCILVEKESPRSIADGIIRLLTDPEAARRLAARAYADLQDMTWENCINRLEQVFLTGAQEENPTVVTQSRCELTIGVPIHNQPAYVKACLESIFANTTSDFELILVDDQSSEETQTLVRDAQRSHPNRVRYLRHEMRRGFPYNCNRIISNACGRYICFLNSDTVVAPRWDTLLIEALKRRPDLAAAGPSTSYGVAKNRDRTAQQLEEVHSRRFEMNVAEINDFATALQKREADGIEETEYLNGFCLMIDSAVIPKIGFFNEKFGLGSREEVEFIDRMRMAGYGCGWVKAAYVHHYGNRSFDPYGEESKKLWDRNKQIYFETRNQEKRVLVTDKRIAFFYTAKFTSSTRKRTFEIARKLQRFLDVETFYLPAVTAEIMRAFDIFILQRIGGLNEQIGPEILAQTMAWIEHYRQEGKLFFYDIDDFVFDAQGGTPRRLMQYCDGVIASTPHLLQLTQSLNPRCLYLKNGLDFDRFLAATPAKLNKNKFHVICASLGAVGQMPLSQIAEKVANRDPDIQIHLFRDDNYCQALPNLKLHPQVDLDELFGYMKSADVVLNFDSPEEKYRQQLATQYGIPPEQLNDFVNAKSGLKYYNAAAAAKPFISTPQPSCYAELIQPGANGFLAESIDDFVGLILKLREDPKLRKKVGRRAFEDVLAHYTLDQTLFDYLKALCEMDSESRITNVQPSNASPERAA